MGVDQMGAHNAKRRVTSRSSALLDDDDAPKKSVFEVTEQPKPKNGEEDEVALREMAALQAANPEAFAELMRAAVDGEEELATAWKRATSRRKDDELELPGERVLSADGTSRTSRKQASIRIVPEPLFAIKTKGHKKCDTMREASAGDKKYFINVCSHEDIAEPAEDKRLDEHGEEVEGVSVPVSIGPEKHEKDNKGDECVVVDCVIHPSMADRRDFVCLLAITYVEQKYSLELDRKYKLPRLKYKGDSVSEQWIREKTKKIVQEVGVEEPEEKTNPMVPELGPPPVLVGASIDNVECRQGEKADDEWPTVSSSARIVTIVLECATWRGVRLAHSAFAVKVQVPGRAEGRFVLPLGVVDASGRASVDATRLTLRFDVDHTFFDRPDPGSKPYMVARALSSQTDAQAQPEVTSTTDKYHLKAEEQTTAAITHQKFIVEEPPKGASAAEIAYAAAETARLAAEAADQVVDTDVLPEDKFHNADILSQHYISQREAQAKEKRDSHNKSAQQGDQQDDSIEYIDFDDFRPGGKYSSEKGDVTAALPSSPPSGSDGPEAQHDTTTCPPSPPVLLPDGLLAPAADGVSLQSKLWAELL